MNIQEIKYELRVNKAKQTMNFHLAFIINLNSPYTMATRDQSQHRLRPVKCKLKSILFSPSLIPRFNKTEEKIGREQNYIPVILRVIHKSIT